MTFRKMLLASTWRDSISAATIVVVAALTISATLMAMNLGLFRSGSSQSRMYRIEFPGAPVSVEPPPSLAPALGSPAPSERPSAAESEQPPVGVAGRRATEKGEPQASSSTENSGTLNSAAVEETPPPTSSTSSTSSTIAKPAISPLRPASSRLDAKSAADRLDD